MDGEENKNGIDMRGSKNTKIRDWLKISWDLVYSGFNSSVMNGFIKNNLNVKTFLKNATTQ